jgi:hypothetical protein
MLPDGINVPEVTLFMSINVSIAQLETESVKSVKKDHLEIQNDQWAS